MKATQEELKDEGWEEVKEERDEAVYVEWKDEKTTVIGTLKEIFKSKDGLYFAKVDTGEEKLTMFSLPSILRGKLEKCEGKKVKIVYLGQVKFSTGRMGKDFQVFVGK